MVRYRGARTDTADAPLDVLVVGAGPTGLALAAQLRAYGVRFRLVDRSLDRVRESRALAIQPRTLEALAGLGLAGELVARGNRAVGMRLHAASRVVALRLFDIGVPDTPYPFLLFLSQAETERILAAAPAGHGAVAERGVELTELLAAPGHVMCRLRHGDGREEELRARYVVGCDGAHSTVRQQAGIAFEGSSYPQTFLLADLEVDGLEADAVHTYMTPAGMLFFFPLGEPATWRMLTMRPAGTPEAPVTLAQLQEATDRAAGAGRLRLHDAVWLTDFRLHKRGATRYSAGRVFLAGDAAHIHSPAGAQGMNTGIQDALNLGWKLALVCQGKGSEALLDTYDAERAPVGRAVLRFTDRAFAVATSRRTLPRLARTWIAPRLAPLVVRSAPLRGVVFRTVSQLGIRYRRSPATTEGPGMRRGPRAGARLPDAPVRTDGRSTTLHAVTGTPGYHLLLCGSATAWPPSRIEALCSPAFLRGPVTVHRLSPEAAPGTLHDPTGLALRRLGCDPRRPGGAHYLVRPDGYIGYRAAGTDLAGLHAYLARWLTPEAPAAP